VLPKTYKTITPFQARVYEAIKLIPFGKVSTYKLLANYLLCGSAQAIGQALKRNPFSPDEVPCHRIVRSDLSLGGYGGSIEGLPIVKKRYLLASEGIVIDINGRVEEECLYHFPQAAPRSGQTGEQKREFARGMCF